MSYLSRIVIPPLRRLRLPVLQVLARLARARSIPPGSKVIICPHPDDESFGTGGLIAAARRQSSASSDPRAQVNILFLTSGDASHQGCCNISRQKLSAEREATARRVAAILGVAQTNLHFMRLADGSIPHTASPCFAEVSARLAALLAAFKPEQVFIPHPLDGWPDHVAVMELTRQALRLAQCRPALYHYSTWFWIKMPFRATLKLDWRRGVVVDISSVYEVKRSAIRTYLEDLAPCGRPYCGNLPSPFLRAFESKMELFFPVTAETQPA